MKLRHLISAAVLLLCASPAYALPVGPIAAALTWIAGTTVATTSFIAIAVTAIVNVGLSFRASAAEIAEPFTFAGCPGGAPRAALPMQTTVMPVGRRPWFWPFVGGRATGECMNPIVFEGQYLLADARDAIRGGDLVLFKLRDRTSAIAWGAKRFVGATAQGVVLETTDPLMRITVPAGDVLALYRVFAAPRTFLGAYVAVWGRVLWRNAFRRKLGIVAAL